MARPPIPESGSALTAEWVRRAFNAGGMANVPAIRDMTVEDIGAGSGALSEILRCYLSYEDDSAGAPGSVVVKLASPDGKSRRIAGLLSMYKREYACFSHLAPHLPVDIPGLFYGDFEDAGHRFVLILEDLRSMETRDQIAGADDVSALRAIRGAAALHGRFWNKLDRPPASGFLTSVGGQRRWLSQLLYLACLPPCLGRFGRLFPSRMRRLAEAYGPRVATHMAELARGTRTLTHGDFRLENMFFDPAGSERFKVIDWQATGLISCGLYDVAYFMATSVSTEVRRVIEREALDQYHGILCARGVTDFTLEECWRLYRQCMLHMLLPCICACGGLDMANPRIRKLGETLVIRTLAAIEDLDADEFLPGGGRPLAPARAFPILTAGAYRTYRTLHRFSGHLTKPGPA